MTLDSGRFLRLKSSIDAVLSGISEKTLAAKALSDAYAMFRTEASGMADAEGLIDEFERLFPVLAAKEFGGPMSHGFDPFEAASYANEAATRLSALSGWLNGFVEQARMSEEARVYAEARLKHEGRG